jgi:hypothetical protein
MPPRAACQGPPIRIPDTNPGLDRLLRLARERRKREADSKNDREPDPLHGHLV